MMDGRIPRAIGDNVRLAGISYRLNAAILRGDMAVYPAAAPGNGIWEDVRIRELIPCDCGITRQENGTLSVPPGSRDTFYQAQQVARKSQQLEQQWLQPCGGRCELVETYGTLYLVRAFPKAAPLQAMLRQGAVPPETALALLEQLLEKVEAIHRAGLLHLHIAPQMLYLLPGMQLILDYDCLFDRRRPAGYGGAETPSCYDAPEARLGNLQEICEATDVYSCCAILFEMMLGRPLLEMDILGNRLTRLLTGAVMETPRQFPALPSSLAGILCRGLHTLPHRRFQSAAALRQALRDTVQQRISSPSAG